MGRDKYLVCLFILLLITSLNQQQKFKTKYSLKPFQNATIFNTVSIWDKYYIPSKYISQAFFKLFLNYFLTYWNYCINSVKKFILIIGIFCYLL